MALIKSSFLTISDLETSKWNGFSDYLVTLILIAKTYIGKEFRWSIILTEQKERNQNRFIWLLFQVYCIFNMRVITLWISVYSSQDSIVSLIYGNYSSYFGTCCIKDDPSHWLDAFLPVFLSKNLNSSGF